MEYYQGWDTVGVLFKQFFISIQNDPQDQHFEVANNNFIVNFQH